VDEIAADWILQNGRLITLDPRRPAATALAIAGGRIVAIGSRSDVRGWRGRRTRVVDLAGATVIPGLVDAHAHLDREGLKHIFPTLERCRSIVEIQGAIRRLAAQRPPGEWTVTMPVGVPPFYLDRLRLAGICVHYGGDADVARILHGGQPYTAWAGFVESANEPADYARQAELAARHGLRVNTLVTRCLPEVLDVWESVAARAPIGHLRWVLVHLHAATPAQLARIRRLGAVATTNPISYLWRSGAAESGRLGGMPETMLPHRSLGRLGIPFGLATDNKPANPWLAFTAAVARRDMTTGEILGAEERLSRRQALRALTVGGAWVTFAERERGVLAPGRAADLAVLDLDPLVAPLETLAEMKARLTMVNGALVHGDA
jgi:predicted amidohydrolase YtcJ